ncbi:MAG: type II toxin-antitoxin system HicB family antitoxin [Dysgonamonadaceae bacterium]|jgi:predicted RNase H-like HicB family nuclease|nr:type II toxin-antitoxin system HicB family antitoxin [Dysgonamonadaceae bacterium]
MVTTALIERGKDGTFGIFTPDINSTIVGEGNTVEEAKADFENSVKEIIRFYKEDGIELPDELKDIRFVYKYDIASMFDYYSWINVSQFARKTGINPSLMRQYRMGKTYISENQISKIENTLHSLGNELAAIKL